jgi:hypothetical protein
MRRTTYEPLTCVPSPETVHRRLAEARHWPDACTFCCAYRRRCAIAQRIRPAPVAADTAAGALPGANPAWPQAVLIALN